MLHALASLLLLLAGPGTPGRDADPGPRLERITFAQSSRLPGMVIRLRFSGRVDGFVLDRNKAASTVRFTAGPARIAAGVSCDAPPAFGVCGIGARNDGIVLELTAGGTLVTADSYRDGAGTNDLLLYVHVEGRRSSAEPVASTGTGATTVVASTPAASESAPAAPESTPAVPVSAPAEDELRRLRIDTVVLDAGHGGTDPGTIGFNRMREKDLVLDIARRVGTYLERAGIRVAYTRSDDRFIALKDRGRLAREAGGKLFVSIHANSASSPSASGTETFFLGHHKTDAARDVIERENRVIDLEEDREHYEQFNAAQLARLRLTQSAHLRQSQDLAGRMQEQYRDRAGRKDRKVKEGNLYVLWSAGMPAILTEIGFISNPAEARYLASEEGRDHIASAIFRAIRDYRDAHDASLEVAEAH